MLNMNQFWVDKYINKVEIRGPGQGNGQFQFVLQIFARPPPPARKFEEQIEIDHFGEGPGAYIHYKSLNITNRTWNKRN